MRPAPALGLVFVSASRVPAGALEVVMGRRGRNPLAGPAGGRLRQGAGGEDSAELSCGPASLAGVGQPSLAASPGRGQRAHGEGERGAQWGAGLDSLCRNMVWRDQLGSGSSAHAERKVPAGVELGECVFHRRGSLVPILRKQPR